MTAPLYAIAYVSLQDKKEKLERVWRTIPGNEMHPVQGGYAGPDTPSKTAMLADICRARVEFYHTPPRQIGVTSAAVGQELRRSGISAAECNEWLRSLPPIPLHGENDP